MPQYSDEWWVVKNGNPSASGADRLVTPGGVESSQLDGYAAGLAGEKFAGHTLTDFMGTVYTKRGKELEDEARHDYQINNQVSVKEIGMFTDSLMRYVVSPDGCIKSDGLLEIKILKPEHHIKVVCDYYDSGTFPREYIPQTQMQLLISKRKWVDLYYYNTDLPSLTVRQYPDKKFLTVLRRQLKVVEVQRNIYLEKLRSI